MNSHKLTWAPSCPEIIPSMYFYLDESGDAGYDNSDPRFQRRNAQPFLVFALLVIEDKKSKQRIERIIRQTVADIRRYCKKTHFSIPEDFTHEDRVNLKGKKLAHFPAFRLRLFERLAAAELKWHAYIGLFDKRRSVARDRRNGEVATPPGCFLHLEFSFGQEPRVCTFFLRSRPSSDERQQVQQKAARAFPFCRKAERAVERKLRHSPCSRRADGDGR